MALVGYARVSSVGQRPGETLP